MERLRAEVRQIDAAWNERFKIIEVTFQLWILEHASIKLSLQSHAVRQPQVVVVLGQELKASQNDLWLTIDERHTALEAT
eukprot:4687947-Amphidinium_carterae.2